MKYQFNQVLDFQMTNILILKKEWLRLERLIFHTIVIVLSISSGSIVAQTNVEQSVLKDSLSHNPIRNVYFGDLHVHTSYDIDSRMQFNTNSPDDAYKFAKGEVSLPIANAAPNPPNVYLKISKPLDFVAITPHSEMMATNLCLNPINKTKYPEIYASKYCDDIRNYNVKALYEAEKVLVKPRPHPPNELCPPIEGAPDSINSICVNASKKGWLEIQKIANKHYEKGKFTTFIAYEFTPTSNFGGALHRNVIFKNNSVPKNVLTAFNIYTASALWEKLDETCNEENNCEVIVIPHMINVSDGMFFSKEDRNDQVPDASRKLSFENNTFTAKDYERRKRLEPLIEIHQTKGNSECLLNDGTIDKNCEFESQILSHCNEALDSLYPDVNCREDCYVRNGLKKGLNYSNESIPKGFNPFKYGFVGGTDNQNGTPGATEEYQYISEGGVIGATPKGRLTEQPKKEGGFPIRYTNPGGLTGVWAEENNREAIFDAMKRKEVFATSGTRISVRFFASFDFPNNLTQYTMEDMIHKAYEKGVPMGGDIYQNKNQSPSFLVWAAKDSLSANLHSLQIVKGWEDENGTYEKVYDIACSDGFNTNNNKCLLNESLVDLKTCEFSKTKGASELKVMWTDPEFIPSKRAFYYVRVLENPTCRWSTYDANELGIEPVEDIPSVIQERAWSSPIWYNPSNLTNQ